MRRWASCLIGVVLLSCSQLIASHIHSQLRSQEDGAYLQGPIAEQDTTETDLLQLDESPFDLAVDDLLKSGADPLALAAQPQAITSDEDEVVDLGVSAGDSVGAGSDDVSTIMGQLATRLAADELEYKADQIQTAKRNGIPRIACPEGTCTEDTEVLFDIMKQKLPERTCRMGIAIPEMSCPAMSYKLINDTTQSVSCINCNAGGVCEIETGGCTTTDVGYTCGGCKFSQANAVSCYDCPRLTRPLDTVSTYQRPRDTTPCNKDCMECRLAENRNGTLLDWCVNIKRYNAHPNATSTLLPPNAQDMICTPENANQTTARVAFEATKKTDGKCKWIAPENADTPAWKILRAPNVPCPCGTIKSQVCNQGGREEVKCTLPTEMPEITCGDDGMMSEEVSATFVKCGVCNHGGNCTIAGFVDGCVSSSCSGCQYANELKECAACPDLTDPSPPALGDNRDSRSWAGTNPCRKACSECKEGAECVNIYRRNLNNPAKIYAFPTADNEDCAITTCHSGDPQNYGVPAPPLPPDSE